jgi:glycosyltransferase involved in cell wall biosynthesis
MTIVFNGEQEIEQTIKSVINQTYDNLEYIVIGGGSTDGKIDYCKSSLNRSI